MKRILLAAAAASVLMGCTSYGDMGFTGGVSDRQVGERVWDIRSNGNAFARLGQIEDFVYLRAAEIGREHGFTHFAVLSEESGLEQFTHTDNSRSFNATTNCFGYSCNTQGTFSGPTTTTYNKPHADSRVLFFTEQEYQALTNHERVQVMSVDIIWNDLAPRYID